jgi:hypothetical protein
MADSSRSSNRRGGDDDTRAGGAMLLRETVMELAPGSVLADRFQIRRVLGKGATGVVLEADDRVSRSLVALKVFKPEIATDERWQEIVGSELRHARKIQHPNVCRIYDAGDADGYRFLSMEFATGGTLRQRIKDAGAGRTDEERIADARAVVSGLAAIHEAGIIHRDVKPDNVLRMEDGRLVVTDFGLAIAPGQTTFMSGYSGAVGTPSYMAPEVALGGDATMASDVFSLGVILHELFFDRRPEWETTKRGRFLKPLAEKPRSRLRKSMVRLCSECLEELAPRRPQSAAWVKAHFERAVLGRYGSVLTALRTGKWGLVVGLAVAVLASAVAFFSSRPRGEAITAKVTGVAVNWLQEARQVAQRSGPFLCSYMDPDARSLRAIWGEPPEAVTIDVSSGRIAPWTIPKSLLAKGGCPQWSPDGRSVAFTAGEARLPTIMISDDPQGSEPRFLANGYAPRWLPGGREVAYGLDRWRVAVADLSGQFSILPEAARAEEVMYQMHVSPAGDKVAVLYTDFGEDLSSVVVYSYPDWKVRGRTNLGRQATIAKFMIPSEDFEVAFRERADVIVAGLRPDGVLTRKANLGPVYVTDIHQTGGEWLITFTRPSMSLVVRDPAGEEKILAQALRFGQPSFARTGDAVLEQTTRDGNRVISRYNAQTRELTPITTGPDDRGPVYLPNATEFVYIEASGKRRIQICTVAGAPACQSLIDTPGAAFIVGVSPSGRQLAYVYRDGPNLRLTVVARDDLRKIDLGPIGERCLRWPAEKRLWIFQRSAAFTGWREMDLDANRLTGAVEPVNSLPRDACPDSVADAALALKRVSHEQAELWRGPVVR